MQGFGRLSKKYFQMISEAKRLEQVKTYYFATKLKEIQKLKSLGKPIISLAMGSPDLLPDTSVLESLQKHLSNPNAHKYQPYQGILELRIAMQAFYKKYFQVNLCENTEILPLIGSKEAIMHISMAFLNPKDKVFIPNPGYPTYSSVTKLMQAEPIYYELSPENNWLPNFKKIKQQFENQEVSKIKLMWINYPHMPTGASASEKHFEEFIAFAKKHHILLINDNPYAFILNKKPLSILKIKGAKQVALELNSLSKSHNMAGWRIGMVLGAAKYIETILKVKSNMDSGMFFPVQKGAITAMNLSKKWFHNLNKIYEKRRFWVWKILDILHCKYDKNTVGMFVWAKLPKDENEIFFTDTLLYEKDIFITPGSIFGSAGKGYIRLSLCVSEVDLKKVFERLKNKT